MNYDDKDILTLYSDAEFYDNEFSNRSFEIPFYRRWVERIKGNILEVGSGTGRITLSIAEKFAGNIVGRDLVPTMIEKAKQKAAERKLLNVEFMIEDFRHTTGAFDLIFCATNAVQHLLSTNDIKMFLDSCYKSLNEGGYLIFDIQNPDLNKLSRNLKQPYKYKEFRIKDSLIEAYISGEYDTVSQIYYFTIDYMKESSVFFKKDVAMRMYFPQEIKLLILSAGYDIVNIYGNFDEEQMKSSSSKQIFVLKK